MKLKWGTYTHDIDEAVVSISRRTLISDRGERYGETQTWNISGMLQAADTATLTTDIAALKAAYATNGKDLQLLFDDDSTSAHQMMQANAFGDIKVMGGPDFRESGGAEYIVWRRYQGIQVVGTFYDSSPTECIAFTETLSFSGGGPRYVHLLTIEGWPQRQQVHQRTPYKVVQQGRAMGLTDYVTPPAMMFPGFKVDDGAISRDNPKYDGGDFTEYPVTWRYEYESTVPLSGTPNTSPP